MPDIQLPDIRLYYEEQGEGVPILGIHGTSSSAMIWASAVDELSRHGRVIIYDRRGCTRSQRPEPYFITSVSEQADDAAALLDAVSATPAILIGRSYGGEVAIDLALRYPDHVRALVVLEGAPLSLSQEALRWEQELFDLLRSTAEERGIDAVAEVLLRNVLDDATWEQFPAEIKQMFTDNGPAILAEFRGGSQKVDPAALAAIDKPTLLVAATDSPEVMRQATEALAAAMPRARTALVPGGHIVDPAGPEVLDFINEVLAGNETTSTTMVRRV